MSPTLKGQREVEDEDEDEEVVPEGAEVVDVDLSPRAEGRLDAEAVVNELMREASLADDEDSEERETMAERPSMGGSGGGGAGGGSSHAAAATGGRSDAEGSLQLFVRDDGSVTFNNRATNAKDARPVLIQPPK